MDEWQPIATAPKDCTWFVGKKGNIEHRTHWASDLSGSEQPMFQGFFYQVTPKYGQSYFQEWSPTHWKPESK